MNLSVSLLNTGRVPRGIARAIACGVLLVLPGCFIPNLRPSKTGVAVPATYDGAPAGLTNATFTGSASPDNSAQLRVDEFYNDPILLRLVCQAMANNRELKILEEDVQIARAAIMSSRGAILPLADFRAGAGWDRNSGFTPLGAAEKQLEYRPGKHFPETPGDFLLGFNFLVPLDIWRALRNARDAAIQRYLAAIERRNDFVTRMVADIAQNYYGLMALDQQLATLDQIIRLQQRSLEVAEQLVKFGRGNTLAVRRFEAEVRKNQSEKLIVRQEIVETENRINFLVGRPPQPVERDSAGFFDLTIHPLSVGVPPQLLLNRPDIRQAERELQAAGLDIMVARARFFPRVTINGNVGYEAFNPRYLFNPEALVLTAMGELVAPVLNKAAIRADYVAANARQLEAVYNYQRVIINAVIEVVNRLSKVQNYSQSILIKRQQLQSLEAAVDVAGKLFQATRIEYVDVLFSQRDLLQARTVLIDTKRQQLTAIVNVYQALGGGYVVACPPPGGPGGAPQPRQLPEAQQELPPPRKVDGEAPPPRLPDPPSPPDPGKAKGAP
ncbi:MAG TPA: TolC family protein [Gemmataceae bacterium]|nr:TolC family protein [Gemmataceae bacterium]